MRKSRRSRRRDRQRQRSWAPLNSDSFGSYVRGLIGVPLLWMVFFLLGDWLPFFATRSTYQVMLFVALPLFVFMWILIVVLGNESTESLELQPVSKWAAMIPAIRKRTQEGATYILIVALVAATCPGFHACMAYVFSNDPFVRSFKVDDMGARGGTGMKFYLVDEVTGEDVSIVLTLHRLEAKWKIGEKMCITGRSSVFGSIAKREYKTDDCRSTKSLPVFDAISTRSESRK